MKKILHIIDTLDVGGAEKLLVGIINGLEGFEQHLIILRDPETLRKDISRECKFTNLAARAGWKGFWPASRMVRRYLKENKIDIVHSHLYQANIVARLATPASIKLFNSIHAVSSLAAYNGSRFTLYIEKFTYRKPHHIVSVSQEVQTDFDKYVGLKGPATVLYNFIDERFFAPHPKTEFSKDKLRLVAVGNLRHQKNYPYLIDAFKSIPANVSLDIFGEGLMRNELQQQIDKYKLNIRLCGLRPEMHSILRGYDAFIMSSFYEGQPLALLEAMASGLPAILADIPVLREVTGHNALYFDITDAESLVTKIQEVMDRRVNLETLAAASHKRVGEFAHREQYLEKLHALYIGGNSTNCLAAIVR